MLKQSESKIPKWKLEAYETLIGLFSEVDRKGATVPYTSLNGYMTSYIDKHTGELGLRLSKQDISEFIEKENSELLVSYGAVMKDFVRVPDDVLKNQIKMKGYFQKSWNHVAKLPPKPTKKKQ